MTKLVRDLNYKNLVKLTLDWNRVGAGGEFNMSPAAVELQHKCLLEELQELKDAVAANDDVEIIDALCDIVFVGIYADYMDMVRDGCPHDSYPELLDSDSGVNYRGSDTLPRLVGDLDWMIRNKLYGSAITEVVTQSLLLNFDFKKAYENVVMSNWTKYPMVEDINITEELQYLNNESKYAGKDVVAIEVNGHYVFRIDGGKGKIIKPSCFKEPELQQFIWG